MPNYSAKTSIFLLVATKCGGIYELSDISFIEINIYLLLPNAVFCNTGDVFFL